MTEQSAFHPEAFEVPATLPPLVLAAAASEHGTPLVVVDVPTLNSHARQFETSFPSSWKVSVSPDTGGLTTAQRLVARGWGIHVESLGQWRAATRAGVPNSGITLGGVGKSDRQLGDVVRAAMSGTPLHWISIESADEAAALAAVARAGQSRVAGTAGIDVLVGMNLPQNPAPDHPTQQELPSKHGLAAPEVRELVREGYFANTSARVRGLLLHASSVMSSADGLARACSYASSFMNDLSHEGVMLDTLEVGGGIPWYGPGPVRNFEKVLHAQLRESGAALPARVGVHSGGFPVAAAGWLVTTVLQVRPGGADQFAVLDAGRYQSLSPAPSRTMHPVFTLSTEVPPSGRLLPTWVVGPSSDADDVWGRYQLPGLRRGDRLAIGMAGGFASGMTSPCDGFSRTSQLLIEVDGRVTCTQEGEFA